jgi:putative transposase
MPDVLAMRSSNSISFRRRHLPHWMVAGNSYFVTIRLKGSLPQHVLEALATEKTELLEMNATKEQWTAFHRQRFLRLDTILDRCASGPKHLENESIAECVFNAFGWLESERGWEIRAVTVMPNHVHALLRNAEGRNHCLNQDLGCLKGYTARQANQVLGRSGPFWMDENFDHWCRSEAHAQRATRYIARNPVKADLVADWRDWRWTRVGQAFLPDLSLERT